MAFYEIDFTYDVEEYGTVVLEADDKDFAEADAIEYVKETYSDVKNITLDEIKEIIR